MRGRRRTPCRRIAWRSTAAARGIEDVSFDSIVARHGKVPALAADARTFKTAFVVLSEKPAPDDVLTEVAKWAAVFGGRTKVNGWPSFEDTATGLAKMDTQIGPRRSTSDKLPKPRAELRCDVLAQDCPGKGLGCHEYFPPLCALSLNVKLDQSCETSFACAPALECMANTSDTGVCKPYCDPDDATSAQACDTLCPGKNIVFQDENGKTVRAACRLKELPAPCDTRGSQRSSCPRVGELSFEQATSGLAHMNTRLLP